MSLTHLFKGVSYIHVLEHHSTLKRKEILTRDIQYEGTLRTFGCKISQSQKDKHWMVPLTYEVPRAVKYTETERTVVARGWGERWRRLFNGCRFSSQSEDFWRWSQQRECT